MLVFSVISAIVGLALWTWPYNLSTNVAGSAVPWWAWTLTPLTAHVVGGWYLAAATLYATLSLRHTPQAVRVALIGVIAATGLELIGAVWQRGTFNGPPLSVWLYVLNVAAVFSFTFFSRVRTKAAASAVAAEPA